MQQTVCHYKDHRQHSLKWRRNWPDAIQNDLISTPFFLDMPPIPQQLRNLYEANSLAEANINQSASTKRNELRQNNMNCEHQAGRGGLGQDEPAKNAVFISGLMESENDTWMGNNYQSRPMWQLRENGRVERAREREGWSTLIGRNNGNASGRLKTHMSPPIHTTQEDGGGMIGEKGNAS